MLAVIPIRDGEVPAGTDEAIAECDGRAWLVGSGTAAAEIGDVATDVGEIELGDFQVARWAATLTPLLVEHPHADVIVLPNSPDGRDLAPRLAFDLRRPLLAGVMQVRPGEATLIRRGGLEEHTMHPDGAFVATLQPGVRGVDPDLPGAAVERHAIAATPVSASGHDVEVIEVLPPDVSTMDLTEARRIVGGGAGLDAAERFEELVAFAESIGGSMGATRVVTDRSWVPHDKQIGTTGVVVDPDLYVAFAISGAVQHTSGLGDPDHIISVNTDPHCPMMQMADLAIVSDANATLHELRAALTGTPTTELAHEVVTDA